MDGKTSHLRFDSFVITEQIYQAAIEITGAIPYFQNYHTGYYEFVGEGISDLTGYSAEEFTSDLLEKITVRVSHSSDLTEMQINEAQQRQSRQSEMGWQADHLIKTKDGKSKWLSNTSIQVYDHLGRVVGFLGVLQDITDRRKATERIRDQEAHLRAILESIDAYIYVCSQDQKIEYMNEHMIRRTGRDATGEDCFQALHDLNATCPWCVNERVFRGETVRWEIKSPKDNHWYYIVNTPIRHPDGSISKQALIHDITESKRIEEERRKLELQVLESQKRECLGMVSSGIAYEFNNILTGMLGNLEILLDQVDGRSEQSHSLNDVMNGTRRIAHLAKEMLALSTSHDYTPHQLNLADLLETMLPVLQSFIPKNIELITESTPELPDIIGDDLLLRQVVMNLVNNSIEAIGEQQGQIRLGCKRNTQNESDNAESICLEVTDNGKGMEPDELREACRAFYSTKPRGVGLGLSSVRSIVANHHGEIDIQSDPGEGTTIQISLPVSLPSKRNISVPAEPSPPDSDKIVLVIDDEMPVRSVTTSMLNKRGYRVLQAVDGVEGVSIFRQQGDQIGLILLDMKMPRKDGRATFEEIHKLSPETPIVLISGFTDTQAHYEFGLEGLAGYLQKPYGSQELIEVVSRFLSGKKSERKT